MTERLGVPLEVRTREAGEGRVVVEVAGDLVVTSREAVRLAVEAALGEGARTVIVDAARMTHVDTASLALLARLAGGCRGAGGDLVVAALPSSFAVLARELRLEEALTFVDSVERAAERPEA